MLALSQPFYIPDAWFLFDNIKYLGLLSLVGYVPFFLWIKDKSIKETFWWSLLCVSLYFSIVLYWLYIALTVHGGVSPAISALITYMPPLILAIKTALALCLARFISLHFGFSFLWIMPVAICAVEYFRNYFLLGGFPWGNLGYSLGQVDEFLQLASVFGVYGLVFFVVVINALITWALTKNHYVKSLKILAIPVLLCAAVFLGGSFRISAGKNEFAPSIRVAMLQGNIAQEVKGVPARRQSVLETYQELSERAQSLGADLIVWPETAYPTFLDENASEIIDTGSKNVASIVGAAAYGDGQGSHSGVHYHNSAFHLDYLGHVVKRYDKSHLVPFGEYVPWPFSGLVDKVVPGIGAWRPGNDLHPLNLEIAPNRFLSVGTSICYEGIFPEISRAFAKQGASLLVNLTNDAWYDRSSAPFQHFMMYRLRAVETGRPFVRATNSGISGWIDAFGRVNHKSHLFVEDLIIDDVPLLTRSTIYVVVGDVVAVMSILILVLGFMAAVVPIHRYVMERAWGKLLFLFILLSVALIGYFYYSQEIFDYDESASTKKLLIYTFCLMLMVGGLHTGPRAAQVLRIFAISMFIISFLFTVLESPVFLVGALLSILIYYLAFRMKARLKLPK